MNIFRRFRILFSCILVCISFFSVKANHAVCQNSDSIVVLELHKEELQVDLQLFNSSKKINNAYAVVNVTGGIPPYKYRWSKQQVSELSDTCIGLTEGSEYSITVTDRYGNNKHILFTIDPESLDEKINAFFVPIVRFIEIGVMADLFAKLGLYDPQIVDEDGIEQFHPNGDPMKNNIPFVVVWIILGGLFFTFFFKFINVRGFKHAIELVQGKYDDPSDKGEVSHFQALATALSATVGLGNIAGVAIAITLGGPGATFWMIIAGLLGMSLKFAECTLGVKYRTIDKDGNVSGGPMYYLSKGLEKRNMKGFGKVLAAIFALVVIFASFGGGNMFQANQAFSQFADIFHETIPGIQRSGAIFGMFLSVLVGIVIIGGIKSIARVTEKIVPLMALLYLLAAFIVIGSNIDQFGSAISLIFSEAFSPAAAKGGVVGVLIMGFRRASFSNEAGVGSAPIAHSAVKTNEPVGEGIVSLLEPFIDTVIICTVTALVIIFTGLYENPDGLNGVKLTSAAFETVLPWFKYILAFAIFLFAFSTMISWSYYGLKGFNYLFGKFFHGKMITPKMKLSNFIYFILFLGFIIIGSASSLGAVIDFSDMMILTMAFPNIIGLIIMAPEIKKDLNSYFNRLKTGEIKRFK